MDSNFEGMFHIVLDAYWMVILKCRRLPQLRSEDILTARPRIEVESTIMVETEGVMVFTIT